MEGLIVSDTYSALPFQAYEAFSWLETPVHSPLFHAVARLVPNTLLGNHLGTSRKLFSAARFRYPHPIPRHVVHAWKFFVMWRTGGACSPKAAGLSTRLEYLRNALHFPHGCCV